jgi:RNA-binding protein YhbY
MVERFSVGVAGITQELVNSIHEKWIVNEVVKFKFDSPLSANMRRAHQILEVQCSFHMLQLCRETFV